MEKLIKLTSLCESYKYIVIGSIKSVENIGLNNNQIKQFLCFLIYKTKYNHVAIKTAWNIMTSKLTEKTLSIVCHYVLSFGIFKRATSGIGSVICPMVFQIPWGMTIFLFLFQGILNDGL